MTNQEKVQQFMVGAKQAGPESPKMPAERLRIFREKLIGSEFLEMVDAKNLEGIADAIGDLLYTVYGTAVAYGLDAQRIFDEVHRSNMTKLIDGKIDRDGKLQKGPSYSPPNLDRFLK